MALPQEKIGHAWQLILATSRGNGFVISTVRYPDGTIANLEIGPVDQWMRGSQDLVRAMESHLPSDPVTLTEAVRLWRAAMPADVIANVPNSVAWGFWSNSPTNHYHYGCFPTQGPVAVLGHETSWAQVLVAHETDPLLGPHHRYVDVATADRNSVVVDLEKGNLLHGMTDVQELQPFLPSLLPTKERGHYRALSDVPARADVFLGPLAVASTSMFMLLAIAYFYPFLKYMGTHTLLLSPGYAKLRKSELLNNRFRDELMARVRAEPGISPPELHARTGGGWSTVVYHLGVLEKNRFVSSLLDGRHKRFFPVDTVNWTERSRISALRNTNTRRAYEAIAGEPGIVQSAVAKRIGQARATVQWHVGRLEEAGLVARQRSGFRVHYYPRPPAESHHTGRSARSIERGLPRESDHGAQGYTP